MNISNMWGCDMYVNDKDFKTDDEFARLEKEAMEEIERITEMKSIPFLTEAEFRSERLEKVYNLCKHFIKDMNMKGQSMEFNKKDKENTDEIITMLKDILKYIETGST